MRNESRRKNITLEKAFFLLHAHRNTKGLDMMIFAFLYGKVSQNGRNHAHTIQTCQVGLTKIKVTADS